MSWKVEFRNIQKIYKDLGIEERGIVQKFLGKTVADNLKKYVSFDSGTQEQSTNSIKNGEQAIINVPYAQFQAGGKVMVGVEHHSPWARRGEKKVVTSKDLQYHSDRLRGAHPFERMKADKRESILRQVAAYARRISK